LKIHQQLKWSETKKEKEKVPKKPISIILKKKEQKIKVKRSILISLIVKIVPEVNSLNQGFPTCGTRTTGGTQTGPRWYAEIFKVKHLNKKNIISSSAIQK